MLKGGISAPRNKALMKILNMIGIGERAGSGVTDIYSVGGETRIYSALDKPVAVNDSNSPANGWRYRANLQSRIFISNI
ncbi:MAG: hypothetical protein NC089_09960 [Bacteroides sp.]|nr:hypothetical protein [Bacteroides sp.]MCM1549159.1 hypothetical protein [Clostridium sp.]